MNRNLKDGFNLLRKTTPLRIWNAIQVWSSYYLAKTTGKAIHWGMPLSMSFEPTTSCNLRCPECPSGLRSFSRPIGMLEPAFFQTLINQVSSRLSYLVFYFQGEPYLNKNFLDMVKYASQKGIYTATSTNAHYLDSDTAKKTIESGLDRLIISIDGTTQDVYEQYRIGGKLEKVIEGTKQILHWKKELNSQTPHVIFQFLVVKPNEHQIQEVLALAEEIGVDEVALKTAQIYDYENGSPLIPSLDKYSRYRKMPNGTWQIKAKIDNQCWRMWQGCVITWDGSVVPCCFDKDANHALGKVSTQFSFPEIWKSSSYKNFRQSILSNRSQVEICKNCTEGTKVWAEA
jgi:radical SAM protein with 4Fe4S-binding SPASM domain